MHALAAHREKHLAGLKRTEAAVSVVRLSCRLSQAWCKLVTLREENVASETGRPGVQAEEANLREEEAAEEPFAVLAVG